MKRTLKDLTLKDNFMFSAAMMRYDNCKQLLELILEIPIKSLTVDYEKSIIYRPESHGIRLDVIAEDEQNTHYNVEMQVSKLPVIKRSRYYHSSIDMDLLASGESYDTLPDVYVIFICDYDPIGLGKYRYSQQSVYLEAPEKAVEDGVHTIYLNTRGTNDDEVPQELIDFLHFVRDGAACSISEKSNHFINSLQNTIQEIRTDRSMEEKYMLLEEMLRDKKREGILEGKKEDILTVCQFYGDVPASLASLISELSDADLLEKVFKFALKTKSLDEIEEFIRNQY